jgi:hypothetical protein
LLSEFNTSLPTSYRPESSQRGRYTASFLNSPRSKELAPLSTLSFLTYLTRFKAALDTITCPKLAAAAKDRRTSQPPVRPPSHSTWLSTTFCCIRLNVHVLQTEGEASRCESSSESGVSKSHRYRRNHSNWIRYLTNCLGRLVITVADTTDRRLCTAALHCCNRHRQKLGLNSGESAGGPIAESDRSSFELLPC